MRRVALRKQFSTSQAASRTQLGDRGTSRPFRVRRILERSNVELLHDSFELFAQFVVARRLLFDTLDLRRR
jgi:hypothetical protein